jgi:hypothetical protein
MGRVKGVGNTLHLRLGQLGENGKGEATGAEALGVWEITVLISEVLAGLLKVERHGVVES